MPGEIWVDIRKHFLSERVVWQWHRLHGEVVESLSLEVLKKHGDAALRDVVSGHGGDGLAFGCYDLAVFFNFNDSVTLCTAIFPPRHQPYGS